MLKRLFFIVALCTCVMVMLGTEAFAGASSTCVFDFGGTFYFVPPPYCTVGTGSVIGDVTTAGLGNIIKDPKNAGILIEGTSGTQSIRGLALCGNPGAKKNQAPGIQPAYLVGSFTGFQAIREVDHNGTSFVEGITATPSYDQLQALGVCPNDGWIVTDFVPCEMQVTFMVTDEEYQVLGSEVVDFYLPDCETLGYDKKTGKFEKRYYVPTDLPVWTGPLPE